jgi:hypothetical protein
MSNQKRKRNHWVPESYLRGFAADARREKIWRLGKETGDPELKPIRNVAVRFYLYAPRGPSGRNYEFEQRLATLEQCFGHDLWVAASTDFVDLRDEAVRKILSLLTSVMFLRNPANLSLMKQLHHSLLEMFLCSEELPGELEINGQRISLDRSSWPAYRDATDEDIKRMWLFEIGAAASLAKIMMNMRWSVLLGKGPVFATSDNPVMLLHPTLRFRGIRNPLTTLMFPLSPTRVLVMDNRCGEPDGQYYAPEGNGEEFNGLLWRNSLEHLFASRHPEEICAEICTAAESN